MHDKVRESTCAIVTIPARVFVRLRDSESQGDEGSKRVNPQGDEGSVCL